MTTEVMLIISILYMTSLPPLVAFINWHYKREATIPVYARLLFLVAPVVVILSVIGYMVYCILWCLGLFGKFRI